MAILPSNALELPRVPFFSNSLSTTVSTRLTKNDATEATLDGVGATLQSIYVSARHRLIVAPWKTSKSR